MDQFESFFKRADLDHDGRISGAEGVSFFQGSGLSKQILAQVFKISPFFHVMIQLYIINLVLLLDEKCDSFLLN
ncbi:hypothetical protein RND81_10G101100 [Saponaria officinalis]|uniref:EF-hand domain-containing protein n=1 Tax=Saponaria officinalis TaxID=3572 RepID=A0AAW1I323_SAPOF